ncbi:MAG: hypothetical protein ACAH80_08170 [Alphaproteobacteria bacterium]
MADWTPENEKLIRELGDFMDKQMRDVLDPKASTLGTSSRVAFNFASHGMGLFKRAEAQLGMDRKDPHGALQKLVDLCEANGSDAAAKIKKVMPIAKQLADEFGFGPDSHEMGKLEQLRVLKKIKNKGIKYD